MPRVDQPKHMHSLILDNIFRDSIWGCPRISGAKYLIDKEPVLPLVRVDHFIGVAVMFEKVRPTSNKHPTIFHLLNNILYILQFRSVIQIRMNRSPKFIRNTSAECDGGRWCQGGRDGFAPGCAL